MTTAQQSRWINHTLEERYRIDERLDDAGVGMLFRGFDLSSEHDVSIRIFAPQAELASDEAQMLRELEALQQKSMAHPSLAELLTSGIAEQHVYTVSEWPHGIRLADRMRLHGKLLLEEFVPLAVELLKPIGHAHSRGIAHGDLGPETISLGPVKILDHGFAPAAVASGFISPLDASRTPAPEQLDGQPADPVSDVYALGVLFFYLLSGHLPWPDGGTSASGYRQLAEVLPAHHGIAQRLISLIQICLAREPERRPLDANDLFDELLDAVDPSLLRAGADSSGTKVGLGFRAAVAPRPIKIDPVALPLISPPRLPDPPPPERPSELLNLSTDELPPPLSPHPPPQVTVAEPVGPTRGRGRALAVGLAASLITVGITMVIVSRSPATDTEAAATETMQGHLEQASKAADAGEWQAARDHLRLVEFSLGEHPQLRGEAERLRQRIEVGQLLDTARELEERGKSKAAITAYRDLLTRDPTHVEARERLVELTAPSATPEPPPNDDAEAAMVAITGSPRHANLYIDGRIVGTTPYQTKLTLGAHTIRLEAEGHEAWEQSIEVTSDNNAIKATLKKIRRRGSGSKVKKSVDTTPNPPKEPDSKTSGSSPLRPTDSKRPSGPFLPTK